MIRDLLAAIGGGALSALLYASVALGTPTALLSAYFAPLPLFLVGLGRGTGAAAVAALLGTVAVAFGAGRLAGGLYGIADAAPVVAVVALALKARPDGKERLRWPSAGTLTLALTALGLVLFAVGAFALMASHGGAGLEEAVRRFLADALSAAKAALHGQENTLLEELAPAFPALVIGSWLVMMAINGALAQGALLRIGEAKRPAPDIALMDFPVFAPYAVALAGALALAGPGTVWGYVGQNLLLIFIVPHLFMGLGVLHALIRLRSASKPVLALVYVLMVLVPVSVLLIAGLGFVEQWAGIRRRWAGAR